MTHCGADPKPGTPVTLLKHELRTPINHIIGYSEILLEDAIGARAADIAGIRKIAWNLVGVIDAALSPTRLDGSATVPAETLAELRRVVKQAARRIRTIERGCGGTGLAPEYAADLERIAEAAERLYHFARTGHLRASE